MLREERNVVICGGIFNNVVNGDTGVHPQVSHAKRVNADAQSRVGVSKSKLKKNGKWEKKVLRRGDVVFKFGLETDIVIPIFGPAGTGKSTFINRLIGKDVAGVGHDYTSGTTRIEHFETSIPSNFKYLLGRRLILVDTPGFDDICITDGEILRRIAAWLAYSYADRMTIGGIIYLQDISPPRLHPSSKRNVDIFRDLCGSDALSSVVITTGKWDLLPDADVGVKREEQLKEGLWGEVISAGGSVGRFEGTQESAWKIISAILDKVENTHHASCLQIQKELVDLLRRISETDAGRTLRKKIASYQAIQREKFEGERADDSERKKLKNINKELAALKVPLSRRLQMFFGIA